ncbi:MAG: VanZ family protein [Syntrophothermus sp.]
MFSLIKNRKIIFALLIIYWVILFVATSLPSSSLPDIKVGDKIEHFLAFFILAILLNLSLKYQNKSKLFSEKSYLFTFIIIFVYSIIDELHQHLIPGRFADFYDFIADNIGAILGLLFTFISNYIANIFYNKKSFNN